MIGKTLAHYSLERKLGQGACVLPDGEVFLADWHVKSDVWLMTMGE